MTVSFEIPDWFAERLGGPAADISRAALEALAVEAYRQHRITRCELQQLMEIESFYEMEVFLKQHKVPLEYSIADFETDAETSRQLREKRHL
jgi:chromosome segregation and condensation protein ScpB